MQTKKRGRKRRADFTEGRKRRSHLEKAIPSCYPRKLFVVQAVKVGNQIVSDEYYATSNADRLSFPGRIRLVGVYELTTVLALKTEVRLQNPSDIPEVIANLNELLPNQGIEARSSFD